MSVKTKSITLRMPVDLLEYVEEEALKTRRSKSNLIEWLIYQDKIKKQKSFEDLKPKDLPILKLSQEDTQRIENELDEYYAKKKAGYQHKTFSDSKEAMEYLNDPSEN